jgi:TolA-binding protein
LKLATFIAALMLAWAPMQCGGGQPDHPEFEDSPPEALWELSERFHTDGDEAARRRTLEYLIERYPASRFAERARVELGPSQP